ncbi:non-ribosomal peptide synthetase [Williamsia sp. 1135]|uniref:non-ribosomal peptide synthetase n=1 Tax=Williamsia sp. 1135 TaxID=1889262 RepID=UPI000A0FF8EA|nr:non-ribosomal peptide synthetase [Williamsia sp. 1135]ORM28767.1 hypothetical protein BFL43_21210 [Williamsia sp. 1135]
MVGAGGSVGGDNRSAPLSAAQVALWYAQQALGDTPIAIAQYIDISGPLDTEAVRAATESAGRALGSTISRIAVRQARPILVLEADVGQAPFEEIDLRTTGDPVATAHAAMDEWCRAPLPLDSDNLIRNTLLRVSDHRWFLFSRAHHIVLDGYGAYVLLTRIARSYQARVAQESNSGDDSHNDCTPIDYHLALAEYESTYRASPRFERDREYWAGVLGSLPAPVTLSRRSAPPSVDPIRATGPLSPELATALSKASERPLHNRTGIIVAALTLYLARASGRSVVAMMMPVAARVTGTQRRSAGTMSNLVPLVLEVRDSMTLSDLVAAVSSAVTGALRHQTYRYEQMLRDRGSVITGMAYAGPVLNIFPDQDLVDLGGELTATYHVLSTGPVSDLNVNIYPSGDGGSPTIDFEANPLCHDPSSVVQHRDNLIELLGQMCASPADTPIGRIGVVVDQRREGSAPPPHRALSELLATHRQSARPAVVDSDTVMSHADLANAVELLANTLRARTIGPEDRVAVMLSRSIAEVIAFHAVAAVGACYVPIDPRYPRARQEFVLMESAATIVLCSSATRPDLLLESETLQLGPGGEHDVRVGGPAREGTPSAHRAAYVIFTSGSTGTPKGVVVTDAGLSALAAEICQRYALSPNSVVAHIASPAFDTAVVEVLCAAISGAALVIVPDTIVGGPDLAKYLTDHSVSHVLITPGVLATLDPADIPTVTHIVVGGDVCPPEMIARYAQHATVRCAYGPTETTCSVTMTDPVVPEAISPLPLPIGHPMSGVRVQILDRDLRPVLPAVGGDLYVSGPAVARGYLDRPGLTAANFVADPTGTGARMYRTGDRAAWRADGSLDFLGRTDHQVKIRGNRVEPAEVDAVLRAQAGVKAAITVAVLHRRSTVLASYVAAMSQPPTGNALRESLEAELPPYMVPTSITFVDEIPLTPAGKVDRTALPAPSYLASTPFRAAGDDGERSVVAAFVTATGAVPVGADDDFFELGGDSLSATGLVAQLNSDTGASLTVRDVFEYRTPAALALRLGAPSAELSTLRSDEHPGPHVLAPAQRNVDLDGPVAGALIPFTVQIAAELDLRVLNRAASTVICRHVMLRSRYVDGGVVIDPADSADIVVPLTDPDSAVAGFLDVAIDPAIDHPIRLGMCVLAGTTTIAVCAHHLFVDGWSLGIIARDLAAAYSESIAHSEPPHRDAGAVNYLDYTSWANRRLGDVADPDSLHHRQVEFWRSELVSISGPFSMPSDRPRPATWDPDGTRVRIWFDDLWPSIRSVAAVHAVSTTTVLRASLARLLCRRAGADVVTIGALTSGRIDHRFDDVVGMFVNTVPVVCQADHGDVSAHLAAVASAEMRAMSNADVPFVDVAREMGPPNSAHPLFQVMLTVENGTPTTTLVDRAIRGGLVVTPRPPAIAKCDMHVAVTEGEDGYVDVLYPVSMWEESTLISMVHSWFADVRRYPGALS